MTDCEWNKQYNDWSGCGSGREGGQLCREYQAFRSADEIEKIYDEIWNHANTIHLYSSLAEEESKSITMKEKQKEIIRTTEEILNIIYKYKGNV